jgi:transposase
MTRQQQHERILKYRNEGLSFRSIAQRMGLTKYQVEKALQPNIHAPAENNLVQRLLEPHRGQILEWVEVRQMPARLIYQRLCEKQIQVSESSVRRYLRTLKKPELYVHVPTTPGHECQIDFGYLGKFHKEGKYVKVWVFCQVLSHSRYAFYKAVTNQTTETFFRCQIEAMEFFGGVTSTLKIDNLGAGVLQADFYQPMIQKQYADMAAHYQTTIVTCRIARGQDKGIVESGIKYVKNSFLRNLETREFDTIEKELAYWNKTVCNLRIHGTLRATPLDIYLKEEKHTLRPLPLKRYELLHYERRTVNQFGHIYYNYNQYSVPAHLAGETVLVAANETVIRVMVDDIQVALHLINSHRGKNITVDHHQPIHKQAKTSEYYRQLLEPIGDHALTLFERLVDTFPYEWKRMCNGIRHLSGKYSHQLINEACKRALSGRHPDYRQVKEQAEKLAANLPNSQPTSAELTKINGYAHDLSQYDHFVTPFID